MPCDYFQPLLSATCAQPEFFKCVVGGTIEPCFDGVKWVWVCPLPEQIDARFTICRDETVTCGSSHIVRVHADLSRPFNPPRWFNWTSEICTCDVSPVPPFSADCCMGTVPYCPAGQTFDDASGLCQTTGCTNTGDGSDCPAGTYWDAVCRKCVRNCGTRCTPWCYKWNPQQCRWEAPDTRCTPPKKWDWSICQCFGGGDPPCETGKCWCRRGDRCKKCKPPRCSVELHCKWDHDLCDYVCDNPFGLSRYCPTGLIWNWRKCKCTTECPPGQCWCSSQAQCIPCPASGCSNELHCEWDIDTCAYVCDSTAALCGPGRTWNGTECRCDETRPGNFHDEWGRYHLVNATTDGLRFRRSDGPSAKPWVVDTHATSNSADRAPRLVRDWRGRLILIYDSGIGCSQAASDDDGATWSDPVVAFGSGKNPVCVIEPRTRAVLQAAFIVGTGGEIHGRIQYPGDLTPQPEFTFQVKNAAGQLVTLTVADAGFDISVQPGGAGRWILAGYKSGVTDVTQWVSTDECRTWAELK